MGLVEVIVGQQTSKETLAQALDFVAQLRKTPIVVNDSRGFYTSRVFQTLIHEGGAMLAEGIPAAVIENAAKAVGLPVGPLALMDELTFDLPLKIVDQAIAQEGDTYTPPAGVRDFAQDARRTGPRRPQVRRRLLRLSRRRQEETVARPSPSISRPPLTTISSSWKRRLLYAQAIETARCLDEGVLETPQDADLGAVYGWGFPAWTGGTISYIDTIGAGDVRARSGPAGAGSRRTLHPAGVAPFPRGAARNLLSPRRARRADMRRLIFNTEHDQFRDSARRFFESEVAPHAERWREQGFVDRNIYLKAGEQGLLLTWAEERFGGLGLTDFRFEQIIIEENIAPRRDRLLHQPALQPGRALHRRTRHRGAKAAIPARRDQRRQNPRRRDVTEPAAGSDLAGMRTRAEDKGDHWLLNGSKTYISNGQLADVVVVAARTDPESRHGLGLFLVEAGTPGFERGQRLRKLGLHAQDTSELFFADVKLPKHNILGEPGQGFRYLAKFLAGERLVAAIGSMAAAQTAFDLTLEFVKERRAFGKPIGAFQNSRFVLAGLRTELDAAQTFIAQCVLLYNDRELTAEIAAECKLLASELEGRVMDACLQLHGGAGYIGRIPYQPVVRRCTHNQNLCRLIGNHEGNHRPRPGLGRAQADLTGVTRSPATRTVSPSIASVASIWHDSRRPAARSSSSSIEASLTPSGGSFSAQAPVTRIWQVPHAAAPPHSARMPTTSCSTAARIRLIPTAASMVTGVPSG